MNSFLGIGREELSHMLSYMLTLVLTSFVMGVFTNLLSSPIEKIIDFNPMTIFILIFLFAATVVLATLLQRQLNDLKKKPEHPREPLTYEWGLYLSLAFFISIVFKGCTETASLSPWAIVGAGFIPLIVGKIMIYPYLSAVRSHARHIPPPSNVESTTSQSNEDYFNATAPNPARMTLPVALEGRLDVQHHHLIIIIIIETILSIKSFVTQTEVFEACRRFTHGYLSNTFIETIQLLMFRFFQERRKLYRDIDINQDDRSNWILFEKAKTI